MAPDPVETAVLEMIDRRFDRRMLTAGLGEAGFRLQLPLRLRKIPLLRQRVQIKHRIQLPAVLRTVKAAVETAGPEFRKPLLSRLDDRNGMVNIRTLLHDLIMDYEPTLILDDSHRNYWVHGRAGLSLSELPRIRLENREHLLVLRYDLPPEQAAADLVDLPLGVRWTAVDQTQF